MIFSCGPTWDEVKKRRGEWHPFFALWPRVVKVVDGHEICAWLQIIERRSNWYGYPLFSWSNEYRLPAGDERSQDG